MDLTLGAFKATLFHDQTEKLNCVVFLAVEFYDTFALLKGSGMDIHFFDLQVMLILKVAVRFSIKVQALIYLISAKPQFLIWKMSGGELVDPDSSCALRMWSLWRYPRNLKGERGQRSAEFWTPCPTAPARAMLLLYSGFYIVGVP